MAIQELVCLACSRRRRPGDLRFSTSPPILVPLAASCIFCLSHISTLSSRRWLAVENILSPITSQISSVLARRELRNLDSTDVMGFLRPRPAFLARIIFRVTTRGVRDFDFPKKRRSKKFSRRNFSTPANMYHVLLVSLCKNIHYNWIAHTTTLYPFMGIFPRCFANHVNVLLPYLVYAYDLLANYAWNNLP